MSQQELKNTAKQLALAFSVNREHKNPFPIQFCNVNFNGPVMKHLLKHIPTLYNPEFPINISHKSYLDMFPREKLVYLTPHCRNEMTHFDYDSVYIIGSMVDRWIYNWSTISLVTNKKYSLTGVKANHIHWPLQNERIFGWPNYLWIDIYVLVEAAARVLRWIKWSVFYWNLKLTETGIKLFRPFLNVNLWIHTGIMNHLQQWYSF